MGWDGWYIDWTKVQDTVVTLVAAFGGAWAAFAFERSQKKKEEDERRIGAAHRARYTLFNIWSAKEQLRKQVIEPHRTRDDAWLNMAALPQGFYGSSNFDAADVAFLLSGDSMVYAGLLLEEQRFDQLLALIKARSDVVLNEAWPCLDAGGVGMQDPRDAREIERILGVAIVRKLQVKLQVMTAGLIQNVDENLTSIRKIHDEMRNAMKRRYPKEKFLRIQPSTPQTVEGNSDPKTSGS